MYMPLGLQVETNLHKIEISFRLHVKIMNLSWFITFYVKLSTWSTYDTDYLVFLPPMKELL